MADTPLEQTSAQDAYETARHNTLRRYPSPDRDGSRLYPLAAPTGRRSFQIEKNDRIFTAGSCFARNVEAALTDVGMQITSNETDLGVVGESLGSATNFFNKYSIHSIYNDLQLGMSKLEFPLADIRDFRNRYLDVIARAAEVDVIIITLGYVETWYDNQLGIYLNASHHSRWSRRIRDGLISAC